MELLLPPRHTIVILDAELALDKKVIEDLFTNVTFYEQDTIDCCFFYLHTTFIKKCVELVAEGEISISKFSDFLSETRLLTTSSTYTIDSTELNFSDPNDPIILLRTNEEEVKLAYADLNNNSNFTTAKIVNGSYFFITKTEPIRQIYDRVAALVTSSVTGKTIAPTLTWQEAKRLNQTRTACVRCNSPLYEIPMGFPPNIKMCRCIEEEATANAKS